MLKIHLNAVTDEIPYNKSTYRGLSSPGYGMIGVSLGNWIIDAEIRKNEMGRLCRAHAADDPGRVAAVKWLTHSKAKAADFERLFLAQIDLLCKLKHPSIVAVLGGGMHEGSPYYAMDWVDGTDFESPLRRGEKLTWQDVLAIALKVMPALRYAHRRSVLHRDLKPSNLFRCADGSVKVSDFGVTKFFGDALLTNADNILGSASYLSPEQAAGKAHTKRSDFYAFGCLLYTLIVGRPPFTGNTVVELIHKHCFVLAERPIHFVRDLPEEIDRFVMRLILKEPAQRPGSGTLLLSELEGIWSAMERRGLVGKRPEIPLASDDDKDVPPEELAVEPFLPEPAPREPLPLLRRWYVVAPAFAACLLLLLWAFFWRGPSADELMSKARPLLESENPTDWDTAWSEYLEPLSRKYPDRFREEVQQARKRIDQQSDLRRALITGKSAVYHSQAERFYHEGLRLVQAGEFAAARKRWDNVVKAYGKIDGEKRWVALASEGIHRLDQRDVTGPAPSTLALEEQLRPVIAEIERLRTKGMRAEADEMARALESLYRDDPAADVLRGLLKNK